METKNLYNLPIDISKTTSISKVRFRSSIIKIGDRVKTGQQIAEVGNTGWSECPHLHFMVYPKEQEYKTLEIRWLEHRPRWRVKQYNKLINHS